jgi:phosphoglycolate phosphatase
LEYLALKRYRHIIWDWNGTLLDDAAVCVQILNKVLALHGKPQINLKQYRALFGFPVRDYYCKLGFDFSADSYDQVADEYIALYRQRQFECPLHLGASEVLDHCLRAGFTQSILSAYQQDLLTEAVTRFGLSSYFVRLAGRKDCFADGKVAEARRLLSDLALDPTVVVMVGDTIHDAEVSTAVGVDCVLVAGGHQDVSRLQGLGCRVLESIRQMPALLAATETGLVRRRRSRSAVKS